MPLPPGFHDHEHSYSSKKLTFINRCFDLAKKYCYKFIETPHIELANVLTKGGEEILKEIYFFTDKGSRELGLRFDHTVPLLRYYTDQHHILEKPFKRFTFGNVFRGEKPQKGRFREFCQVDFDIIGCDSWAAEFEVLDIICKALSHFQFECTIRINDRKIVEHLAEKFDCNDKILFFRLLDKRPKLPDSDFKTQIISLFGKFKADEIIRNLDNPEILLNDLKSRNLDVVASINRILSTFKNAVFDLNIVRGLEYYDGTVFEIFSNLGNTSISSGGRYKTTLVNPAAPPLTAFGGSIGVDRIVSQIELPEYVNDFFIVALKQNTLEELLKIREQIIQLGYSCEVFLDIGVDTKNQLKYAEKKKFRGILFIRSNEINLFLKSSGEEKKFETWYDLLNYLKEADVYST